MKHKLFSFLLLTLLLTGFMSVSVTPAHAVHCKPCGCESVCIGASGNCSQGCAAISTKETGSSSDPKTTMGHITDEFKKHREWMVEIFFKEPDKVGQKEDVPGLLAAMQIMTSQLVSVGIQQVQIIGTFFDAKHQLETQRLFQELTARAHKDYHPSEELCEIGTVIRSLSPSFRNSDLAVAAFSKRSVDRQLLSEDMLGAEGIRSDQNSRLVQFIKKYCNKSDNSKNLDLLCQKGGSDPKLFNKDVNYTATVESPLTLDIDFTQEGSDPTEDEYALFALTANLFSHNLFPFVAQDKFVDDEGEPAFAAVSAYMDARAISAKRAVASNSMGAITAMKVKGTDDSQPFIYALIKEMGGDDMSVDEIKELIGEKPSYFAQMEILTKKLYQNPNFYTELYDKPANVMRKDVAIQAATLMQKRDLYRSYLRSEMVLAVMLEAALQSEQNRIMNEINKAKEGDGARTGFR